MNAKAQGKPPETKPTKGYVHRVQATPGPEAQPGVTQEEIDKRRQERKAGAVSNPSHDQEQSQTQAKRKGTASKAPPMKKPKKKHATGKVLPNATAPSEDECTSSDSDKSEDEEEESDDSDEESEEESEEDSDDESSQSEEDSSSKSEEDSGGESEEDKDEESA